MTLATPVRRIVSLALLLAALCLAAPARAQQSLDDRARQIAALLVAQPQVDADMFDPAFLAAVPVPKLAGIGSSLFASCGAVESIDPAARESEFSGRFDVTTAKGFVVPITLSLGAEPPHRVVGLWFGPPTPALPSLEAVVAALAALPGEVSFAVARLSAGVEPELLASHRADAPLAIGSAFKLWVLGALAQDVAAGTHRWDEVVPLRAALRSLPSGRLQDWPAGAPVTLDTLAVAMISESDNTAADHLLFTLGRERVERALPALGVRDAAASADGQPPRNEPFLATQEMFRLKLSAGDEAATVWLALHDVAARRRFLADDVPSLPLSGAGTDGGAFAKPSHIDTIEWFASAADLVRTMDALRRLTAASATAAGRDALAVNPGLPAAREQFAWAGYKGGSETGVLSLNWLLRARGDGAESWYAVSAIWNDPAAALDETRFTGLLTRALQLLARSAAAAPAEPPAAVPAPASAPPR